MISPSQSQQYLSGRTGLQTQEGGHSYAIQFTWHLQEWERVSGLVGS